MVLGAFKSGPRVKLIDLQVKYRIIVRRVFKTT